LLTVKEIENPCFVLNRSYRIAKCVPVTY